VTLINTERDHEVPEIIPNTPNILPNKALNTLAILQVAK
jgi:hypothetical protein